MSPSRTIGRQIVLTIVAFVATLALLTGAVVVFRSGPGASPGPSSGGASGSAGAIGTPAPAASASAPAGPAASTGPGAGDSASPSADPILVGAGDIARCKVDGDEETAAQVAGIVADLPATVFAAGDLAYDDGSPAQYRDCYDPTWGAFKDRTRPVPGNHDYQTSGATGYLAYWGTAATPNGSTWYSFDLGTWHVIMLDSNCDHVGGCGATSAEGRWLAADLDASPARCTLAIFHHPRWSSGEHGNDRDMDPIWRALYRAGVDLIVNGHDHDYERFAPLDPSGNEDRAAGIREFVVGTGGGLLRPFQALAGHSEFRLAGTYGVMELVLRPVSYEWSFLPVTGDVRDSGSSPCH